ncbi:MAG: AMP-binding protein, partial [Gemmatimonadales bacterium]
MSHFRWTPPPSLVSSANVTRFMNRHGLADAWEARRRSAADPEWFWNAVVEDLDIRFERPYTRVLDESKGAPWAEWFVGGTLNLAANVLFRHAEGPESDDVCLIAQREDGKVTRLTWKELASLVRRCAAGLRAAGVKRGDRVGGLMPMTAEVVVQFLACAQAGAIFIPVFSGYAPPAVAERLADAGAVLLFTADGTMRRGKYLPIKPNADLAVAGVPTVSRVVVVRDYDEEIEWDSGRDILWDDFLGRGE